MPIITPADLEAKVTKRTTKTESDIGLVFRKEPTGTASFSYRTKANDARVYLGNYPDMSLKAARNAAERLRQAENDGEKVAQTARQKREAQAARVRAGGVTVERAVDEYVEYLKEEIDQEHLGLAPRNRTWAQTGQTLHRNVVPALGRKLLADVTDDDLHALEKRIRNGEFSPRYNGTPLDSSVRHTRRALSGMFEWAKLVGQKYVKSNPCETLEPIRAARTRTRFMSEEEIRAFWLLLNSPDLRIDRRTALLFKLALVTGRRSSEVRELKVGELIDLDGDMPHMIIPATRTKNKKPLVMALSKLAVGIIREALTDEGQEYVFESPVKKGQPLNIQVLGTALRGRPDKGRQGLIDQMGIEIDPDDAFKPHDFRHTIATILVEEMGDDFNDMDVSIALGHTFKGERVDPVRRAPKVTQGYINGHRLKRKRKIMEAWADYLQRITGANVVPLRARA